MPKEATIVRTELDTLLPQVPAASHSPMSARLGEAAPAAAVSRNNLTPSPPPKREGGPAALPTYPPTPLRPVPAASGNELRVLTVEQSTSLDSARSLRLDDIKSGDARHLEWMTKFIAAQWRMIPLDILAPPVARRMIPDDTGDVADTKSAASDTQQQPQQQQQQQQQQQPIDVSTAASQNSARDVQRVTAWHSLRLSWRRRLAEPLINKDDDALAVWRKAVFAGMMTSTVLLSVIKLLAAFIAHFAAPINGIQEGGYFLLIGCILLVKVSLYIYTRHTQELTEWATYAVLVLLMAEQHVWLSLNGQHYASVAVLAHSLLLLTWLFAVVSPVVKFCGVTTAFVFSLVGFIQSELIHRHGPEEFLMHSPNGTVASNSFLGVLVVWLSFQCLFSLCTIAFLLFERQSAQSARHASVIIQNITQSLVIDDFHAAMRQLEAFDQEALDLVGGSAGQMLAMRFADLAQIMKQLRPYVPFHAFRKVGVAAHAHPPSGAGIAAAAPAAVVPVVPVPPSASPASKTIVSSSTSAPSAASTAVPRPVTLHPNDILQKSQFKEPQGAAERRISIEPNPALTSKKSSRLGHQPGSSKGFSRHASNPLLTGNMLPSSQGGEDWEESRRESAITGSSATNSSGGGLAAGERRRSFSEDTSNQHAVADAGPPHVKDDVFNDNNVTLVLVTFRGRLMSASMRVLDDAVQIIQEKNGLVELVGYNYMLASFFVDNISDPQGVRHRDEVLGAIKELRQLFQTKKGSTISAHRGSGWAGVCETGGRQWRFVGGTAMEIVWKMPTIARQDTALCIATEFVVDPSYSCVCPIDVVQLEPHGAAAVIYEVTDDSSTHAPPASRPQSTTSRVGSVTKRNGTPRYRHQQSESPLAGSPNVYGDVAEFDTGIQLVVPTVNATRNSMIEAAHLLCTGQPHRAAEVLRHIQTPSWHVQTWRESLVEGARQGLHVVYKDWLGWGVMGVRPSIIRAANKESRDSSKFSQVATPSTSTVNVNAAGGASMDWSTTSFGGGGVRQPTRGSDTAHPMVTTFERVNAALQTRNTGLVEQDDCLFSLFVEGDGADSDDNLDEQTILHDSSKRRYILSTRELGHGAYGSVYYACGEFGGIVAVKRIDVDSRQISANAQEISNEIHTLSQLRHDNIVGYIGDCFLKSRYYYIIMECVPGGSLGDLLQRFGKLPTNTVAKYLRDALMGLLYLHNNRVVHCDIKPHNILVTAAGRCKLSDFGSSVNKSLEGLLANTNRETSMATHRIEGDGLVAAAGGGHAAATEEEGGAAGERAPSASSGAFVPLHMPPEHLQGHTSLQTQQDVLLSSTNRSTADSGHNNNVVLSDRQQRHGSESSTVGSQAAVPGAFLHSAHGSIVEGAQTATEAQPPPVLTEPPQSQRYQHFDEPSKDDEAEATSSAAPAVASKVDELVVRGTAQYMSPEACRDSNGTEASDVWSVGITAYQLITGQLPWLGATKNDAIFISELGKKEDPLKTFDWKLLRDTVGPPQTPTIPSSLRRPQNMSGASTPEVSSGLLFGDAAVSFIQRCLVVGVAERATVDELLRHPFLSTAIE